MVRAEAEDIVDLREYNTTLRNQMAALIGGINAWFDVRMKKRRME